MEAANGAACETTKLEMEQAIASVRNSDPAVRQSLDRERGQDVTGGEASM